MTDAAAADHEPAATPALPTSVTRILRVEGAVAFAGASVAFFVIDGRWPLFALFLLVPDLSMLGYRLGPAFGARLYNAAHTYALPGVLALAGWLAGMPTLSAVALIWVAHIGADRALGYGLKYPMAFSATHLGGAGLPGTGHGT